MRRSGFGECEVKNRRPFCKVFQQNFADFSVGHFPAAKPDGNLQPVTADAIILAVVFEDVVPNRWLGTDLPHT